MRLPNFLGIFVFLSLLFLSIGAVQPALAQTSTTNSTSFNTPNVDPDVPQNQHTFAQSAMIEVLSATVCQLVGVDPLDPSHPCLSINPETGKLGYDKSAVSPDGEVHLGGLVGTTTHMIGMLYTPTVSSGDYFHYVASNFGIAKPAYAAHDGFTGLKPVLNLWLASRNIAYSLLVLAFIFIGLGVMLRFHIDPRTVMTIQNQIPRIIICILLITFSYAIAGLMIDMMWVTTYVGINALTSAGPETNPIVDFGQPLSQRATNTILDTPISYFNQVFSTKDAGGMAHVTDKVSSAIVSFGDELFRDLLGGASCLQWGIPPHLHIEGCLRDLLKAVMYVVFLLVVFICLLVALFKVWFDLLKAYAYILADVIGGPFFIVAGLLPGKPLGFEKWIRSLFANLFIFPVMAALFVMARIFMNLFSDNPKDKFIPPLIGNPNAAVFGAFLAFAIILAAPGILTALREKLKTQGNKHIGAAIVGGFAAGRATVGGAGNKALGSLNKTDQYGRPVGYLARKRRDLSNAVVTSASSGKISKVNPFRRAAARKLERNKYLDTHGHLGGFKPGAEAAENRQDYAKERQQQYGAAQQQARRTRRPIGTIEQWTAQQARNNNPIGSFGAWSQARRVREAQGDLQQRIDSGQGQGRLSFLARAGNRRRANQIRKMQRPQTRRRGTP